MSIDISDEVSEEWTSLLERWNWRDKERPKQLIKLVRKGNYIEYTVEPVYTVVRLCRFTLTFQPPTRYPREIQSICMADANTGTG